MIESKKQLKLCLEYEKKKYSEYGFQSKNRYFISRCKREPARMIYLYIVLSRKTDYYHLKVKENNSLFCKVLYFICVIRRNRLGEKLGLEIETKNIGKGLMIYHYNNVINGGSVIGENCHLHGNNCIGNSGKSDDCPIIGNNVMIGVGAKVIGGITIADHIKIAAGAVVVHSFMEKGITIAGVPAKKITNVK